MSNTPRYFAALTPGTSPSSQLVTTPRPVPSSFAGRQRISSTKSNEIYKMPCLSLETSTSTRNFVPEAAQRKWPSLSVSRKRQRRSLASSPGPINLLRRPWKLSRERSSKIVAETPSRFLLIYGYHSPFPSPSLPWILGRTIVNEVGQTCCTGTFVGD